MQHLKNIKSGNPKTKEQYQLTKNFDVIWLYTEDGKNWYEELKNFQEDTIKILYDENNIIVAITKDASTLNPEGYSVVEIPDITANRRADDSGKWMFKDGTVVKRIYTADEQQQAESQKAALLSEAESVIQPLERAVRLNMATDIPVVLIIDKTTDSSGRKSALKSNLFKGGFFIFYKRAQSCANIGNIHLNNLVIKFC